MKTILSSIRSFAIEEVQIVKSAVIALTLTIALSNPIGNNFSGFTGPHQLPNNLGLTLIEPMG